MGNYLKKLEQVKTGKEFYELLDDINEAGYSLERKCGFPFICAPILVNKYGTLREDDGSLYKGPLNEDDEIYISYLAKDRHHSIGKYGKCQLRNCSKLLKLVSAESKVKEEQI